MSAGIARIMLVLSGVAALAGCARPEEAAYLKPQVTVGPEEEPGWRDVVQPADVARLERLPEYWKEGLAAASSGAATRTLMQQGPLLDPNVALPHPAPPPGNYRCRVWRMPASARPNRTVIGYKPFSCYVGSEDSRLTFIKESGSDRPGGWIWPDGDSRLVFLGAMAKGNEQTPPPYGADAERDVVGVVERVAAFRWRLVMPHPTRESRLDVIELVPMVQPMQEALPS